MNLHQRLAPLKAVFTLHAGLSVVSVSKTTWLTLAFVVFFLTGQGSGWGQDLQTGFDGDVHTELFPRNANVFAVVDQYESQGIRIHNAAATVPPDFMPPFSPPNVLMRTNTGLFTTSFSSPMIIQSLVTPNKIKSIRFRLNVHTFTAPPVIIRAYRGTLPPPDNMSFWSAVNLCGSPLGTCVGVTGFGAVKSITVPTNVFTNPNELITISDPVGFDFLTIGERTSPFTSGFIQFSIDDLVVCSNLNACYDAPTLVDPVPQLLNGPAITPKRTLAEAAQGQPYLADLMKGRVVTGIAADGVAQVVIRIPAKTVDEQFDLSVRSDQCASISAFCLNEYGRLFDPASPPANIFTDTPDLPPRVSAVSTSNGPMAFAAYRAPVDFVRSGPPGIADKDASQRSAFITINSLQTGMRPDLEIRLVRPPVVLVHGLWGSRDDWNDFTPIVSDSETRFVVTRATYAAPVSIVSSNPTYAEDTFPPVTGNTLGFAFNARVVSQQVESDAIRNFRTKTFNAAVQADIVAHSMGGDISRTMALRGDFYSNRNYNSGFIHKLITIGTPHLGSPLATELLRSENNCSREFLAWAGKFSFSNVIVSRKGTTTGGVGDLQGDKNGGTLSAALGNLKKASPRLVTAMIAGEMTAAQLSELDCFVSCGAAVIQGVCSADDTVADSLRPARWPGLVGASSDAVVPVNSQVNGSNAVGVVFSPAIHSAGMKLLGFGEPGELDAASGIPDMVVHLLNTPLTNSDLFVKQ